MSCSGLLPLSKELPQIAFWLLPGAIGILFIARALGRHPLLLGVGRSRADSVRSPDSAL